MKRVLAAVDNSAVTRPVLSMARAVASVLGAEVDAVHIAADGHETATSSAESAGLDLRILTGDPGDRLWHEGAEPDVVALVLGMRDHLGGPRPVGHLAASVLRSTDKPVILVPPEAAPPDQLSRVLIALEGSPGRKHALTRTLDVVADAGLELVVVHVDEEVPRFTDQIQHETAAYASGFFERHLHRNVDLRIEFRVGAPAREVLSVVDSFGPELVAIGWPHSPDEGRGKVAKEILSRSTVPVMLVPVD